MDSLDRQRAGSTPPWENPDDLWFADRYTDPRIVGDALHVISEVLMYCDGTRYGDTPHAAYYERRAIVAYRALRAAGYIRAGRDGLDVQAPIRRVEVLAADDGTVTLMPEGGPSKALNVGDTLTLDCGGGH